MILSKNQINRYLRHIIIPEISGPGQKKITELRVVIVASTVKEASALIYYLAAAGVGYIYCSFENNLEYEKLFDNAHDLNEDVSIDLVSEQMLEINSQYINNENLLIKILLCNYEKLKDDLKILNTIQSPYNYLPTIVAINSNWKGYLQTFKTQQDYNNLFQNTISLPSLSFEEIIQEKEGSILSNCLLGAFIVIECIKLGLNIGTPLYNSLFFNLLSMNFEKLENENLSLSTIIQFFENKASENSLLDHKLFDQQKDISVSVQSTNEVDNFKKDYKKKLSESKVLIVGTGGLGSPVAYALSSIGIGTIGFVDYDNVEVSNLNRQILHSTSRVGIPKVQSAKAFINKLNSNIKVVTYNLGIHADNIMDIIKDYDIIIDAVDNFQARYLLNDSCYFLNKPLVDAAAVRFHGLIMTILPGKGPCYRCAFPVMPDQNGAMRCSEAGVLGPVPGVMGFMQAIETAKLLLNVGKNLDERIIYYDALDSDFDTININRSLNCNLCGTHPTITTLIEYNNTCENNKIP